MPEFMAFLLVWCFLLTLWSLVQRLEILALRGFLDNPALKELIEQWQRDMESRDE